MKTHYLEIPRHHENEEVYMTGREMKRPEETGLGAWKQPWKSK
jgi:hypothetical protein